VAVVIVMGSALAACARASVSRAALTSWEPHYISAEGCRPVLALDGSRALGGSGDSGKLVVRLASFDTSALTPKSWITLSPLAPLDTVAPPVVRLEAAPETAPFMATLVPGRYVLASHAFGYEGRTDTVVVRAGATDTVSIALEEYAEALRNRHNCRPRGFRRIGEPACVTDRITTVLVLDRARDMASPRFRFGIGLPNGDSTDVHLVVDERICERAANIYGLESGPPRRVVVVEAGNLYVVYDPAEPVGFGDLNQWLILDKRWRVLARMVL
jgi:hypothetical protein